MRPSLPAPVERAGLSAFRRLPAWARRRAVHAGTPSYQVGAVIVLRDPGGRLLLVRQRHSPGWALPGGLLRSGEPPERAVTRETAEELGISLDPVALDLPRALVDAGARRVDLVFTLPCADEATADGVEILDARWFDPASLPDCAAATAEVLRRCGLAPRATAPSGPP